MEKRHSVIGWIAVILSVLLTSFWGFWGINETFHEGWYFRSFWQNVLLMICQYMSFMLIFYFLTLTAIRWPKVGAGLFFAFSAFVVWFFHFRINPAVAIILFGLIGLGILYLYGRPKPKKAAYFIAIFIPILSTALCGIAPIWMMINRMPDDGIKEARIVPGNGVTLVWAPAGPGWPEKGCKLEEALRRCKYLKADGKTLAKTPQNIWRLPTIDEAVRSLTKDGKNCEGTWNPKTGKPHYKIRPDKENPLWDRYTTVIYWWTSTEKDEKKIYRISYNGYVLAVPKKSYRPHTGFRAVKEISKKK